MIDSKSTPTRALLRGVLGSCEWTVFFPLVAILWFVLFVVSARAQSKSVISLHYFPGNHASYGPIKGPDGNLYGADAQAAAIYKLTPAGAYSVLCSFTDHGIDGPDSNLLLVGNGSFWGIAHQDSTYLVYRVTPDGALSVVHSFTSAEGSLSFSNLIQGTDGNFYGSSVSGGAHGNGTVYRLTPDGILTVLYSFAEYLGYSPTNLVQGRDGNFYGTSLFGGTNEEGSFFTVTPNGAFTTLYSFNTTNSSPGDIILGRDGNFYGVTAKGGPNHAGTLFSLTPAGAHKTLATFTNVGKFGNGPIGRLLQTGDGTFFGTTSGANATIFELTPAGNLNDLYFIGGIAPDGGLLRGADGNFYGKFATASQEGGTAILKLISPPTVSLIATVPAATANTGQVAKFQLSLSSPAPEDLVATYEVQGTGTNGVDYGFLKGFAKIKAGKKVKTVNVVPAADPSGRLHKVTVKITLQTMYGCLLKDSSPAKVELFFPAVNEPPPGIIPE